MGVMALDKIENLDSATKWARDGLEVVGGRAGGIVCVHVDVTEMNKVRRHFDGITYTHLIVKTSADLLKRRPDLHRFVVGNKRLRAGHVDVGISVAADFPLAPILVVHKADQKSLEEISIDMKNRTNHVRSEFAKTLHFWNTWGALVFFSQFRRFVMRLVATGLKARRQVGGTFQITNLPQSDLFIPLLIGGVGVLGVGGVSDRAVVVDSQIVVRPMMTICFSFDHSVYDGKAAADLLAELKKDLENCSERYLGSYK